MAEEPSLPYYLPIAEGRIIGFIPFPRVFVLCEMQSVSSRIWTCVTVSISYNNNHYTTGTSSKEYIKQISLSNLDSEIKNVFNMNCYEMIYSVIVKFFILFFKLNRRRLWYNGYWHTKWNLLPAFKILNKAVAFHIVPIPLGKVWIYFTFGYS